MLQLTTFVAGSVLFPSPLSQPQTATRSVQEVFPSLEVDLLSNAPSAHRSEEGEEGTTGSKVRHGDLAGMW